MFFFIKRQRKSSSPLIDLQLFRNTKFASGVLTALLATFSLVGMEFVFTQRFQLVLGMSPLKAGLFTVAISIASFLSGALLGLIMHRVSILKIQYISLFIAGLGVGSYLLFYEAQPFVQIICLLIFGTGVGGATTSASASIINNVPEEKAGMAASIEEVSFEIGGAFGVATLGSMASFMYTASLTTPAGLVIPPEAHDSLDEALLAAETLPAQAGLKLIEIAKAAYDDSFIAVLLTSSLLLILTAVAVTVISRRSRVS